MLGFLFFTSVFTSCHIGKVRLQEDNCENGFNCTRQQRQNLPRCPAGFYCPDGKPTPVPCPKGTFRAMESSSPHKCQACPMNFFNTKLGQASCFPCGSEAMQPMEGQKTCLCLRGGRLFQPSDAHCPCAPGYHNPSEDRRWDCVKQRYDICRDGAVRNQEGQCLMRERWADYCKEKCHEHLNAWPKNTTWLEEHAMKFPRRKEIHERFSDPERVCSIPEDYRGYDKVLGLCLCQTDHLDSVCNLSCRRQQRHILQMACGQELAQLSLSYTNGSQVSILLEDIAASLQGLDLHTQKNCTFKENEGSHPVYVVKTNGSGFLGVYRPEPELLHDIFTSNGILSAAQSMLPPPASSGTPGQEASRFHHSQLQQDSNSLLEMKLTGILNPTVCLSIRDTIMFIVSKDHYPVYDVNNLYNTNREFDWGGFRSLAEEAQLASSDLLLLFFYQFHHPGTYVLRLSSNQHKRMYTRVMPYGGQCYEEGPFFPTTPRHAVRLGIAQIPDLILKTDWQAVLGIIIGLISLLLICLLLVIFCPAVGWSRKGSPNPHFRSLQLKYNLSQYSSRESKLVAVRKYHPELQGKGNLENNFSHTEEREGKHGLWDSEEQVDLDSFNTNIFFEILVTQSLAVTAKLSQFKEELKTFYHKLLGEIASLRDLWVTRVGVPDRTEPYDEVLMANYTKVKQQAEDEILRRRYLAAEYEASVSRQLHLLSRELKCQEDHFIAFHAALQEAMRLTETLANSLSSGEGPKPDHHRILSLIDAANNQMSSIVIKESHRLMLWGILGEGTGAHMIDQVKNSLITKEELVGKDGSVKEHDLLRLDPTTGLIVPISEVVVLLANQSRKPIFTGHFVHPGTGKVLPVAGNVSFDPTSSKLIPVVDLISGEVRHSDIPVFPYIPYPMCRSTGLPVKTNFPILQPEKVFKLGGLMPDPASGIEVPILGITTHPQTGQNLSLGGTYVNPLTGTVTPLEIGGPMWASEGGKIVPILGISLDSNTGDLLPVGGLQDPSGNLLLIGDSFVEPLSGKTAQVQGACIQQDKMVPHAGGYQAVLDTNFLIAEIHVAEALREYKDAIWEDPTPDGVGQKALRDAEEDLIGAMAQKMDYLLYCLQNLEKRQEWASNLKSTGGKLGMIRYPGTELWIPAVFGMKIPDPGGSDLMVPILGVECDWKTGQAIPLAGTMEDLHGKGLSPIAVASKTIDPITGETGPVIGAKTNPWTIAVVPIVQFLGSLPRGNPDPDLLVALDKERVAKQTYWHGQREKEEALLKELDFLRAAILDAANQGKMKKHLGYRDKMKPAEEISHFLEEDLVQETQRRSSRDLNRLWDVEHSLQMRVEKDERDQEARVHLLVRKALERLVQFVHRIQLEEGRIQMQLKEAQRQGSRRLQVQEAIQEKAHKIMLNLAAEFQEHTEKQRANVESSHSRLEYLRHLSDRVALQIKELRSGSTQCFINYPGMRFLGAAGAPCGSWEIITWKLIPLLKSVAQMLEEKKRAASSPEMLSGLGSGEGYSSRSTLKVSEAPSAPLRTETKQDAALGAEALSPVTLFQPAADKSQLMQEIQARIFLEKHASEMLRLERSLMVEEINMMSCFCESSRLKQNLGMPPHRSMDFAKDWDDLLQELAYYHYHAEEDLAQHHWEEAHCVGLILGEATLKDRVSFSLEEIQQNLALLGASLRKADSLFRADAAKENNKTQASEAKPGLVTQKIQATAVEIVKQEAVKLICLHRVLDHYKGLFQRWICPEDILQLMRNTCMGENMAREVVQSAEKSQVEKAVAFLQKCDKEGEQPLSFWESSNTEWRKLQALIRTELKEQIEEKLEAKEMEAVSEASEETSKLLAERGTYYLLSWQHLRQGAFLLAAGLRTPGDESHMGAPVLDEPLVDEDTKLVVQLLKENKESAWTLLKLQQVAQMLQLREWQFQEMVQKLQAHPSDQPEGAEHMAKDLQEFRRKKTKALKDQLQLLLLQKSPETREDPSTDASQLGKAKPLLGKGEKDTRGKGKWEGFRETQLAELENSYRVQILEEKARLQDWLEKGDIKRWSKEKLMREHDEMVTFLDQVFQQEMHKRRGRVEKEGRSECYSQEGGHPPTSRDATLQGQDQIRLVKDDQVKSLLEEYIKIMQQTELLVLLRTALLNPGFRSLLSDQHGADGVRSSHLLALLNGVNQELQKYAAAAGLLDSLHPEHDAVNSFQDIVDVQMTSSSTELVPVRASSLSAREFIVYQYGIVILQFLQPHIGGPEVDLGVASSIPPSNAPGNAFRNTFYYQMPERKLFVLRECLSCVGSFILLLVHCLAHIAANDLGQDSSPAFRRLFYQALKACLGEMFSLRLQTSAFVEENKSAARMINEAFKKKEVIMDEKINLLSGVFDAQVMPSANLEKVDP